MTQPIAGVAPPELSEVTNMIVWPTLGATAWGRFWGRRYENNLGGSIFGVPITLGRITALLSVPLILPVYFHMLIPRLPFVLWGAVNPSCRRYRLTNRRVIVEHAFGGGEQRAVSLDRFDQIEVEVVPGQAWYPAGDLIFKQGSVETFRIQGVPRPETFRQTCLKSQLSFCAVQKVCEVAAAH